MRRKKRDQQRQGHSRGHCGQQLRVQPWFKASSPGEGTALGKEGLEGYTECQLQAGLQLCVFQFIPPWQRPQEWAAAGVGSGQQRLAKSRSSWSYSRGKHLTAVVSWTWSAGKRGKVFPGRRGENAVLVPSGSHRALGLQSGAIRVYPVPCCVGVDICYPGHLPFPRY